MEAIFTPEYFLDEIRDGFYIPSIMKRVWAEQITMLCRIDEVCRKYDLKWFAGWGTLLGAVRHQGYIPWDDDVDILMPRADYDKLYEIADKELPREYFTRAIWNDREFYGDFLRINNTKGEALTTDFLNKHNGCFYGCGIDVYPIDEVALTAAEKQLLMKKLQCLNYLKAAALDNIESIKKEKLKETAGYGIKFDKSVPLYNAVMKVWIKLIKEAAPYLDNGTGVNDCNENDCKTDNMCIKTQELILANGWSFSGKGYQKEWFADTVMLPFENTEIPCPAGFDRVLTVMFGDYHTPVRGALDHVFPFFGESQKKVWEAAPELKFTLHKNDTLIRRNKRICATEDFEINPVKVEMTSKSEMTCQSKTAVFLPASINDLSYMVPVYNKYAEAGFNCIIIPIPYMLRNNDRSFRELKWDVQDFEDNEINITRYDGFDFGNPRPDVIVISDPYDSYNGGYSVHPFFYSSNIRKFTDHLVYVQCFESDLSKLDAPALWGTEYYIKQPGIAYADELVLTDETTAGVYGKIVGEWLKTN